MYLNTEGSPIPVIRRRKRPNARFLYRYLNRSQFMAGMFPIPGIFAVSYKRPFWPVCIRYKKHWLTDCYTAVCIIEPYNKLVSWGSPLLISSVLLNCSSNIEIRFEVMWFLQFCLTTIFEGGIVCLKISTIYLYFDICWFSSPVGPIRRRLKISRLDTVRGSNMHIFVINTRQSG